MSSGSPQPYEVSYDPNLNKIVYAFQSGWLPVPSSAESTPPGGSNTQLQYNNNGAFGGTSGLTWNGTKLTAPEIDLSAIGLTGTHTAVTPLVNPGASGGISFETFDSSTPAGFFDLNATRFGVKTRTPATDFQVLGESSLGGPTVIGANHANANCALDMNQASGEGFGLGLVNATTAQMMGMGRRTGNMVYVTDVTPGVYVDNGSGFSILGGSSGGTMNFDGGDITSDGSGNMSVSGSVSIGPTGQQSGIFADATSLQIQPNINVWISTGTLSDADASSLVQMDSTTQGVVFPRMTTTQKNAISSPLEGLVVYDLTLHKLCVRTASAWETITSA